MKPHKLVIVGSGPAAMTAAIYTARANLFPTLYEGFFSGPSGGQLMTTTEVENYPGFPEGVLGPKLMEFFRKQAERFKVSIVTDDVEAIELQKRPFKIQGRTTSCQCHAVIIATGASAKRLDIPGTRDNEFWQRGVTACAVCDGAAPIFRNRDLYVIGGGDSAAEEALFLTKYASKVIIVHRRNQLRASKIMAQRVLHHPKVEVIWDSVVERVEGEDVVSRIVIRNLNTQKETTFACGGVFFAIGHQPNTALLGNQIALHDNGYIKVEPGTCRTSVEGVFAAGDVQDFIYRQAVTAAGTGCMAGLEAERWLSHQGLA